MLMMADAERRWLERAILNIGKQPKPKVIPTHTAGG
jgi:hypothetical protein